MARFGPAVLSEFDCFFFSFSFSSSFCCSVAADVVGFVAVEDGPGPR
jgi:hypothetical protein